MLDSRQIQTYPDMEREQLLSRLSVVVDQLFNAIQEWWTMQADETRTKAEAYISSTAETITGKNKDTELASYHITSSILETRAQVEALKEERNFLLLLLTK